MIEDDFEAIKHFTQKEVEATGADIEDVDFDALNALDYMRNYLCCPIHLIHNGMTTGNHKSEGHPNGVAIDCYMSENIHIYKVFQAALKFGFNKIGIYWNGSIYSYHLEIAWVPAFWMGTKKIGEKNWTYGNLIKDPKEQ